VRNQDRRTGNEETRIQSFARSPGYGRAGRDEMHRRVAQKQGGVLDSVKGDNSFWILRIRAERRRWIYTTSWRSGTRLVLRAAPQGRHLHQLDDS
jgi:hypothetical protein